MATKKTAAAAAAPKSCRTCKPAAKKEEIVKVAGKPVAKKEAAKSVAKSATKPAAKAAAKPVAKVAAKVPVAKPVVKTAAKPAVKAAAPKSAVKSVVKPAAKAVAAEVVFNVYAPESAAVAVAGEFNGWDVSKGAMKKGKNGDWSFKTKLAPGSYQYKIVFTGSDGQQYWELDNSNPERVTDGQGGENSIKHV